MALTRTLALTLVSYCNMKVRVRKIDTQESKNTLFRLILILVQNQKHSVIFIRPIVFSRLGHSMGLFHLNFIPEKAFMIPEKVSTKYQKKFHEIPKKIPRNTNWVSTNNQKSFNEIQIGFQPNTKKVSTKYKLNFNEIPIFDFFAQVSTKYQWPKKFQPITMYSLKTLERDLFRI